MLKGPAVNVYIDSVVHTGDYTLYTLYTTLKGPAVKDFKSPRLGRHSVCRVFKRVEKYLNYASRDHRQEIFFYCEFYGDLFTFELGFNTSLWITCGYLGVYELILGPYTVVSRCRHG